LAVVDERADLIAARPRIGEPRQPLARGQLALLVAPIDVRRAPAGLDLAAPVAQPRFERAERRALLAGGAVVDELIERVTDRNQRNKRHCRHASTRRCSSRRRRTGRWDGYSWPRSAPLCTVRM